MNIRDREIAAWRAAMPKPIAEIHVSQEAFEAARNTGSILNEKWRLIAWSMRASS